MTTGINTITCRELKDLCEKDTVDLIDVRTPAEFQEVHAVHARNVPLDALNPEAVMQARGDAKDAPLFVICRSGSRGAKACEAFVKAGFTNVVNIEGGTNAWADAGYAVNRGRKVMSLERQVRIAAGLLVLTGVVLAHFVHPYLIGLSAFVGAGLVFAGLTDTCGMGMLLAKMPWNQVKATNAPTCCSMKPQAAGKSCCG